MSSADSYASQADHLNAPASEARSFMQTCRDIEKIFADLKAAEAAEAERQLKWDRRYLAMARDWAITCSKDPSTKTGAVLVSPDQTHVQVGYNGFARGVNDAPERYADRALKYKLVCHCEVNAIIFARRDLTGYTLYTWPFMSCSDCAKYVIQAGIARCVAPPTPPDQATRWEESTRLATMQFAEAGVRLDIIPEEACPSPA